LIAAQAYLKRRGEPKTPQAITSHDTIQFGAAPDWRFVEIEPAAFAEAALGWVGQGARIVGGCCGLGPTHIAALAGRLGVKPPPVR